MLCYRRSMEASGLGWGSNLTPGPISAGVEKQPAALESNHAARLRLSTIGV
jgi:hypothetical protein